MLIQSGAYGSNIGCTNFPQYHTVLHGFCRNFQCFTGFVRPIIILNDKKNGAEGFSSVNSIRKQAAI